MLTVSPLQETIRTVKVIQYITPLREGGSLPAIAGADDGFNYVLKFKGAGQGVKALISELLGGEIARTLGFKIPELVFAELDEAFGRLEPDEEIQDLLKASRGLNLGLHYLSGAITFDPAVHEIDAMTASKIVWLDAFLMNVDRTVRNTNMLIWNRQLWLIDHGAALYFHHNLNQWESQAARPFERIAEHVLLPRASELQAAGQACKAMLSPRHIASWVQQIPDAWLSDYEDRTPQQVRSIYQRFLTERLDQAEIFLSEAEHARKRL